MINYCFGVNSTILPMLHSYMTNTAQKLKFSSKDFFSKCDQIGSPAYLVTLTEEILHGKNYFCAVQYCTLLDQSDCRYFVR